MPSNCRGLSKIYATEKHNVSMVYWEIWEGRFEAGTMVDITRAHLSQRKIVQPMGAYLPPTSVGESDGSGHWTITGFLCVKVDWDATVFRKVVVVWNIARQNLCHHFYVKNIYC